MAFFLRVWRRKIGFFCVISHLAMSKVWKIFRSLMSVILIAAVALPSLLFVLLSFGPVQQLIKDIASKELSKALGAEISIGRVVIHPFNRLNVENLSLVVAPTDTVATIKTVSAGFEMRHFLRTGELIIDYALVEGVEARIIRNDSASPLNIQPIIDHLKSDDKDKEPSAFQLAVNTVVLRDASLRYDVLSAPHLDSERFDKNHISISNLMVNAYIPSIANKRYAVDLNHLSFEESCGFKLKELSTKADFTSMGANISDFCIYFDNSKLELKPFSLDFDGFENIGYALKNNYIEFSTANTAKIHLPDFACFAPILKKIDDTFNLSFCLDASTDSISVNEFILSRNRPESMSISLRGCATGFSSLSDLRFNLNRATILADGWEICNSFGSFIPEKSKLILRQLPVIAIAAKGEGNLEDFNLSVNSGGSLGDVNIDANIKKQAYYSRISSNAVFKELDLGLISGNSKLGFASGEISTDATIMSKKIYGNVDLDISRLDYNKYSYSNIKANANVDKDGKAEAHINVNDPCATALLYAYFDTSNPNKTLSATAALANIDFHTLGLDKNHQGYRFGAKMIAELSGKDFETLGGYISITDINWLDQRRKGLRINRINLSANPDMRPAEIELSSDFADGSLKGVYNFKRLPDEIIQMASHYVPALLDKYNTTENINHFNFDFTIKPCADLCSFFNLPVSIISPIEINGRADTPGLYTSINLSTQFLQYGQKYLEDIEIFGAMDSSTDKASLYFTATTPTKKGDMALVGLIGVKNNNINTQIDWSVKRKIPLNGTIDFSAEIHEANNTGKGLLPFPLTVEFNPGTINFGDAVWTINPSTIYFGEDNISVEHFSLVAGKQQISIDGLAGTEHTDSMTIKLNDISLLPIFETLEIDKAMIGGRATGVFSANQLLSKEPELICPKLHVDSIGYNRCTIGDANVFAKWENSRKSFYLDADITGPAGEQSRIHGDILPLGEALDLNFKADKVPVGFLKPFMEAFASDIRGHASGHCRLFGTFKEIDLEGDVFADSVMFKIDFTNTAYWATDSIHLRPGKIIVPRAKIYDSEGNTAFLDGEVHHVFFKQPSFKFNISDAREFLSFNGTQKQNPDWYGTIYGNGGANVSGWPGVVNIKVNMSTAPKSHFTFVLSDRLDAEEYSFVNFRDITPDSLKTQVKTTDNTPDIIRVLKNNHGHETEESSAYNMDITVDITPDAQMTLVMDPASDDEINATGSGHMRLAYNSTNNDLNMWGDYIVNTGSYRFTLQDIIIRDFTIMPGSEISFDGDPYAAKANLQAYYATNANLSDLDKSFLQDRDVARTNVPVHAILQATGDIRQPEIKFDLSFPTLTSDTYRKVRSIVSTEDMMNRQIIYLMALNRFYTPDYMANTTKGNELFSVASSTISSQLGSMLGKISDKWSIAPNFRSDRGDFSDVEVDVALTSRLLNNRLLFNGNFGYRDKSLNTNQFIGDFDIEYLLTKKGNWRLKAYNRYNDANYYLRSAATTQGVGIMFKRDFDNLFNFLKPKKKHNKSSETDSTEHKNP